MKCQFEPVAQTVGIATLAGKAVPPEPASDRVQPT
jgi:hypothetical protein